MAINKAFDYRSLTVVPRQRIHCSIPTVQDVAPVAVIGPSPQRFESFHPYRSNWRGIQRLVGCAAHEARRVEQFSAFDPC